ncbi:beta-galactosidase [Microbacterium thalassium]|uniref:Glycoside hydrolase 35 catalytic domain-containing protein n=1 Tax=Microbacterium thalassium TaxID=362649 RepID=A0A7X0FNA9_9MICO|nr:beta-galactosidase [Microbacterium thalassium]MBB6390576.1 hypothetical protein [Microbacterium thalassium]GLK25687.1 hypothetical protein GCM10017607_30060 [Microbacterium thalassium]
MSEPGTAVSALTLRASATAGAELRPRMANDEDVRPGLELTSRRIVRNGRTWIPVSGEMHYSRVPRERWEQRLRQMAAGGITVVATYVPWIHHAPDDARASFDGNLDVAAFVDLARAQGLEVVLRIGPWVHGEIRNGGFPDWVQDAPVAHRTDDPAYLALVRAWWEQLGAALEGRCEPGTVLGIQLENELYDQPGHLVTLKRLARECGMSAPLWTATAWGGAQLPPEEVFPLYGGYADGFWVDPQAPWDATFRDHFFFSDVWDDPGIGADVRDGEAGDDRVPLSEWFPPATCELGGGMATAYHRRPLPTGRDVATVGHCKIGNGSAWQGYFMYVGGTNPRRGLQESHASGYPNDMPQLGYDFHAPVGESGRLGDGHAELRAQNAFLAAFGPMLDAKSSHLPDVRPSGVEDSETLRWAYRGDRDGGFLFVAWHQPHVPLAAYRAASFKLDLGDAVLRLPSAPIDIPAGTLARWPVHLATGGVRIEWLTASALTLLEGSVPTFVAVAEQDVPVELALGGGAVIEGAHELVDEGGDRVVARLEPSREPVRLVASGGAVDLLVLPAEEARRTWVPQDATGRARRLILADDEITWDADGRVELRTAAEHPGAASYDPIARAFTPLVVQYSDGIAQTRAVLVEPQLPAGDGRPRGYGSHDGRPSAPGDDVIAAFSAEYRLIVPEDAIDSDACLEVAWAGDVADLCVDGRIVADRFWDGSRWRVNCHDAGIVPGVDVVLRILPLAKDSIVHVPEAAQARRDAVAGDLLGVDEVRLTRRALWREGRAG